MLIVKVILAGYNIDADILEELSSHHKREDMTPETISAAYARISRNPKPVNELRSIARREVSKTRQSNKTIIFSMGHHSVAEHAVFNFDIIDVSRLAIEEIEHFRLCSFTEKSQRYIKLGNNFVLPPDISGTNIEHPFRETVHELQQAYLYFYNALKENYQKCHQQDLAPKELTRQAELCGNEDARYILSLATMGQLGMTANARNIELIIRRFASSPLLEIQEIGRKIFECAHAVAPSIILFTEGTDYDRRVYYDLDNVAARVFTDHNLAPDLNEVVLLDHSPDPDRTLLTSLLYRSSNQSYEQCSDMVETLTAEQALDIIRTAFNHAELYDAVLREFEFVTMHWDLIVSASCFAQLKRHRIASLSCQNYSTDLGLTIPPTISALGLDDTFRNFAEKAELTYSSLAQTTPAIAPYILTNAHRRRVHFGCNAREFYHLSRLREDHHAQWDIRNVARKMHESLKPVMPYVALFLGGKDSYPTLYQQHFGVPPKVVLPG